MATPDFAFRACVAADLDRVSAITADAMRGPVERTWGAWDETDQRARLAASFDPATHRLVLVDGEVVGLVAVETRGDHVFLAKLYLVAGWRGRGLGGAVLAVIRREAAAAGVPLRLRVLQANPAAERFWRRHGFVVTSEPAPYRWMQDAVSARPASPGRAG